MHQTFRLLAKVKQAMITEGMTGVEIDRVLMTVVTAEINAKVERFQNSLICQRDQFIEFGSLADKINANALVVDVSRNARNGK